jgi:hypothetical protein
MMDALSSYSFSFSHRLKGLKWSEIGQICSDMIVLFGLDIYETKKVQQLR